MNCACEACGHIITVTLWPPMADAVLKDCPVCEQRRAFYPTDRRWVPHPYDAVLP